jgi:hypothetical protein
VRRVLPLVAIAALTVAAACEPLKKHPLKDTPPGQNIAFYWAEEGGEPDGTNVRKSASPLEGPLCTDVGAVPGAVSQTLTPAGSVVLAIDGPTSCNGMLGFAVEAAALGDLATSTAGTTGGSDQVVLLLAFDVDGDGDYGGEFNADGTGAGFGSDVICVANALTPIGGGTATVADTTNLVCVFDSGMSPVDSLATLKTDAAGSGVPGLGPATPVAVLAATSGGGPGGADDVTATVDSLTINGVEKL